MKHELDMVEGNQNVVGDDIVGSIALLNQCTWRDDVAKQMFNKWRGRQNY